MQGSESGMSSMRSQARSKGAPLVEKPCKLCAENVLTALCAMVLAKLDEGQRAPPVERALTAARKGSELAVSNAQLVCYPRFQCMNGMKVNR